MRRALLFLFAFLIAVPPLTAADAEKYWPSWRGPTANGVAPEAEPPLTWSETENVRWKIELPGLGNASPVGWGDRVYVMSAKPSDPAALEAEKKAAAERRERQERPSGVQPVEHNFVVTALSRADGSVIWERAVGTLVPHEGHHLDNSWASGSPVTDGEVLIAHFGSYGTFAYDLEGN